MPRKPKADVPKLTLHKPTGQWSKCFSLPGGKRRTVYFGTDPSAAMQKYLAEKDEWQAGRNPRKDGAAPASHNATPTVAYVCNAFLERSEQRVETGELAPVTFADYQWTAKRMTDHLGREVEAAGLRPADFARFRHKLATKYAPSRLSKSVTVCRMIFRWAYESDLLESSMKFGPDFKVAGKRRARQNKADRGAKLIEAHELRTIMDKADQPLKAMLLLAANCAYGNMDIASLPLAALDLDAGMIDFPRPKSGVARRCPLWAETVKALREAIADRKPRPEFDHLLFVTQRGGPFISIKPDGKRVDKIIEKFRAAAQAAEVHRPGMGIYWIRHSWRTAADACHDSAAIDRIMGHVRPGISAEYVERLDDARLQRVVDTVRAWLWPADATDDDSKDEPDVLPMRGRAG